MAATFSGLPTVAVAQERLPPPFDFIDPSIPGFRMHAGPEAWEAAAKLDEASRRAIGRRAGTVYMRRTREGGKSRAVEFGLLMLRDAGERVVWREVTDFRACTVGDELRVHWGPDRSEYLKLLRSAGSCPEKDERSSWEWAIAEGQGKATRRGTNFITAETASLRVSLTEDEWARSGHGEIAASLSDEFRRVFGEEIVAMSQVDAPSMSGLCELLKGLLSLQCKQSDGAPLVRWDIVPNCDFDATFGVPCSAEEKRLAELKRRGGRIH
jgi:hypothetical protein